MRYNRKLLSNWYQAIKFEIYCQKTLVRLRNARSRHSQIVFILGSPFHTNLGDHAIVGAATEFIKTRVAHAYTICVPLPFIMNGSKDVLSRLVKPEDILIGPGGGNMGDMYLNEEDCRRLFISKFPGNRIVIFPQTIHFSDTEEGRNQLRLSARIYGKHRKLTLIAREETSYEKMREVFPRNTVLLTPDIVLSMDRSTDRQKRSGLLLCLRDDLEGSLNKKDKSLISDFAKKHFKKITQTDTITDNDLVYKDPQSVVDDKLAQFRSSKLVVTDRLHGMVFAAITGTPCIAMASFNHKVTKTYKWITHLPYIQFCEKTSDLEKLFNKINLSKTYNYDPAHFAPYWDKITSALYDSQSLSSLKRK